jgi:chemotaxis protein CheX
MSEMEERVDLLGKYFVQALQDVTATMSGITITENGDGKTNNNAGEISSVMLLVGEKNMLATISMPRETATILVSYMTGISAEKILSEELYDGVAELVNMVAGQAKAFISATPYRFQITSPFVIVGKDYSIVHKNRVATFCKGFEAADMKMQLKLYFM